MHKTHKQIFKSHITHTMPILTSLFTFSCGTVLCCCLLFLCVSLLHFDFTVYFYILILAKYLGNVKWEVLQLVKFGKLHLLQNVLL